MGVFARRHILSMPDRGNVGRNRIDKTLPKRRIATKSVFDAMQAVSMAHKAIFDRYFAEYPPKCSEMTFTNILCWSDIKKHQFCVYRDHLLVSYQRKSDIEPQFFPPIGEHPKEIMLEPLPGLRTYQWVRIPKTLSDDISGNVCVVFDRDYYYSVEELITLKGKKFEGNRNLIRRCADLNPTVRVLQPVDATACIELQEQWLSEQRERKCGSGGDRCP